MLCHRHISTAPPFISLGDFNTKKSVCGLVLTYGRRRIVSNVCALLNLLLLNSDAATHLNPVPGTYCISDLAFSSSGLSVLTDFHGHDDYPFTCTFPRHTPWYPDIRSGLSDVWIEMPSLSH